MNQKTLTKRIANTIVFVMGLCIWGAEGSLAEERPNIILIMADDVGLECFETYCDSEYKTPNIDSMAKRGMRFDNCFSCPLCTPTRVKIMTGKSNARNYHDFSILPPNEKTFAHYLKDAGYQTAVAGKWQLLGAEHYGVMAGKGSTPQGAGFDEYCLWQTTKLGPRYWNPNLDQNGQFLETTADQYGPDLCVDFICDFISRKKDKPFFVYYPMILGHNPFKPTPHSKDRKSKNKKQNFVDMVAYMDHLVGRIVDHVEAEGVGKKTLVLFLTDNGTNRSITSKVGSKKVKGAKGRTIDHGIHSPLVALWPETIKPGTTCDDMVDQTDFLATFADLAKFELPSSTDVVTEQLDGITFAPQLLGKKHPTPRSAIYCYYHPRPTRPNFTGPVVYARNKSWKLYGDGRLFDLTTDPMEKTPVIDDSRDSTTMHNRAALQQVINAMPRTGQNLNKPKQ